MDRGGHSSYGKKRITLIRQKCLEHNNTYKPLAMDPTNKHKAKLITLLMKITIEGGIDKNTYKIMYSTGVCSPKFYELPKIHRKDTPLGL